MADFKVYGMEELQAELRACAISEEEKTEILTAMGSIAAEDQKKAALEMGVYDEDNGGRHLVDTIGLTKPKLTDDGGSISVTFKGSRVDARHKKRTRNAEIAFVANYGRRGQPARPFVRTANERSAERIEAAGQAVHDKWTQKGGH